MDRHGQSFGIADIALVVTTFLWGLNAVVTKNAIGDSPESFRAFVFNGLRIPAGAVMLFLTVKLSGRSVKVRREHIPILMSVSFFGMFLFMTAFVAGLYLTSASNVGVINATIPLLILLVSMFSGIERPTGRTVAGIAIGFAGMLGLTYQKGSLAVNPGDVIIFLSCACWAYYTVYAKKILDSYTPVLAVAWIYLLTSVFQLPLFIWQLPDQEWTTVSAANWMNLVISIAGSLFVANTLYYYAIKRIGPSRTGVYTNLTPVFTIALAVIMRGESITFFQIAGLAVIIVGIVIARSGRRA
jgi:drug/metabolite transporter (DMT)-like permease